MSLVLPLCIYIVFLICNCFCPSFFYYYLLSRSKWSMVPASANFIFGRVGGLHRGISGSYSAGCYPLRAMNRFQGDNLGFTSRACADDNMSYSWVNTIPSLTRQRCNHQPAEEKHLEQNRRHVEWISKLVSNFAFVVCSIRFDVKLSATWKQNETKTELCVKWKHRVTWNGNGETFAHRCGLSAGSCVLLKLCQ